MTTKVPLYHPDSHEFQGYLVKDATGWQAQTIFGYVIARATSAAEAEAIIHAEGAEYLSGVWQYFDSDEQEWLPCTIQSATEHQVTVIRTNAMGWQDASLFKQVQLNHPSEHTLVKSN